MTDWNYADIFDTVVAAQPDHAAIRHGDRSVSWAEFDDAARGFGQWILDAGVVQQDKVAVYLYNSPEYLIAVAGAFRVGCVPVNTNYRYGTDELTYLWNNADATVVVFHGTKLARSMLKEFELWTLGAGGRRLPKAGIVLTTYETVIHDTATFRSVDWEALVLDEGHRLKAGPASRGFETLETLACRHRVLLTGTPLQNNLEELFHLLHFLVPDKFPSFEAFQAQVAATGAAGGDKSAQVAALKDTVQPHMLRRVKKDVLQNMPPRKEIHVPVELTPLQSEYYRALLTRNYELLAGNAARAARATRLHNLVVQLRKASAYTARTQGLIARYTARRS